MTVVAFTGHRPERIGRRVSEVYSAIHAFLLQNNPERVISGMAQGVDQLAAGWARALKIPWTAAVPFPGQQSRWPQKTQAMYDRLIETAAEIKVISENYHRDAYDVRDRWMVDNCTHLAAVWDGKEWGGTWNTIKYARSIGREITYLEWL